VGDLVTTTQRYRLSLVGGPNCGTGTTDDAMASWPPPMFLYVKGYQGHYRRVRVSAPELGDLDYHFARYQWVPA
jgi:hypothetical protein